MNVYTVSFFGHRELDDINNVERRLEIIIDSLMREKEYVEFLVGRDREFDLFVSSIIRKCKSEHGKWNSAFVLVLPYMRAECRDNYESFLKYYDEVEICSDSLNAHYKSAIQVRNRNMVDRSNLVICCIQHNSGGAFQTVQYAKKKKCKIINVANELPDSLIDVLW